MKRLIIILSITLFSFNYAIAQDWQKNIFGIQAGANMSNVSFAGIEGKTKIGFHVGANYQRLLSSSLPFYLETGVLFTSKGYKMDYGKYGSEDTWPSDAYYLEVPLMVNYKFKLSNSFKLYPAAGVYYAYGIAGESRDGEQCVDTFSDEGWAKRSDFGFRFALGTELKHFMLSIGYELSLINVYNDSADEAKNRNLFISVGYNF